MKRRVLVLGAGRSAPFLIRRLLDDAAAADWQVMVADRDLALAEARVAGHPNGRAIAIDASDEQQMASWIGSADVVANVLAPVFQGRVARLCVEAGVDMVSVSYLQQETRNLDAWATERGVLLLGEMGLDPGIDHMMAAEAVREVQAEGGVVRAFRSFGSGVPAPDSISNPLRYLVTWNPWNVAPSGGAGAQYLLDGRIRIVPQQRLFLHTWPVQVAGVGRLEGYPNRDSLSFLELNPTGQLMDNLRFLGLFDTEPTGCSGDTAAAMLSCLLETRLAPQPSSRDMVIIHHAMEVEYPGSRRRRRTPRRLDGRDRRAVPDVDDGEDGRAAVRHRGRAVAQGGARRARLPAADSSRDRRRGPLEAARRGAHVHETGRIAVTAAAARRQGG
jgi:hypothetical protein